LYKYSDLREVYGNNERFGFACLKDYNKNSDFAGIEPNNMLLHSINCITMRRGFLNQAKGIADESMMGPLQEPRLSQANRYPGWEVAANERRLKSMANHSSSSAVGLQWPASKVPEGAVQFDGPDWNAPNDKRRRMNDEEPRLAAA
jgi:hypothetical protein